MTTSIRLSLFSVYAVIGQLILLLTMPLSAFTQKDNWLSIKMKNADTVLLVSHEVTAGVVIVDSLRNRIPLPKLVVNGRPNNAIIKEQQIITDAQLETLLNIFARPIADEKIETGKCFIPHHAVFIIKNGRTSYIDICFDCHAFDTSKDLRQLNAFDNSKWVELKNFFVNLGFKYELAAE